MTAAFNESQQLTSANASGDSRAVLTPANATEYSKVTMSAPKAIQLAFKGEGLLDKMSTDGRTTIQLDVPGGTADAANKRVTADTVRTYFNSDGHDIQRAEAIGNAELFVEPLRASPENYRTTINAPRFDCEFFPTGNSAKECIAATKTKTVREPTVKAADRGTQTITAERLTAAFSQQTKDVERLDAAGNAKFIELDRHAIADQIGFLKVMRSSGYEAGTRRSGIHVLAHVQSRSIGIRRIKSHTCAAERTRHTTVRNRPVERLRSEQLIKPVFLTAASADFDHRAQTAVV
jgi:hypothetical protein